MVRIYLQCVHIIHWRRITFCNMKLLCQLPQFRRNFSICCAQYSKFFYSRPDTRKIFIKEEFYRRRVEKSEYTWYKEWFEKEDIDVNLAMKVNYRPLNVGMKRMTDILKWQYHDYKKNFKFYPKKKFKLGGNLNHYINKDAIFPDYCDLVIIGGGLTGTSIAYHIKRIVGDALHIVIVDKDFTFSESASVNLAGLVKQQFSSCENFQLSQYAIQFLDNAFEELSFGKYTPNVHVNYGGCLTLASEEDADELYQNFKLQRNLGASAKLMRKDGLSKHFPWMNLDGIYSAVLGTSQEGWYDPWALLAAMHRKLSYQDVEYVHGEVIDAIADFAPILEFARGHPGDYSNITDVVVRLQDGTHRKIQCSRAIMAAGWRSGELAKVFDIGIGYESWDTALPITKKKRYLYYLHAPGGPGLNCPFVIDSSRIFFKREGLGDMYLCGFLRDPIEDPLADVLKTDDDYFKSEILPLLSHRVKAFKDCQIVSSKAVFYDHNEFDQNPVVGYHHGVTNLFIATGFGENNINALGAGNYFMEELMERKLSIDLERCGFLRLATKEKLIDGSMAYLEG